jgi:carboxypeptidase family protein
MRKNLTVSVLCSLLLVAVAAKGQGTLGSLNGTIEDTTGAKVGGATVTATDADISVTRTAVTQGNGYFQIFNLPVGRYQVTAEHDGFDTTQLKGISVEESQATTVNVTFEAWYGVDLGGGDSQPDAERDRHHERVHAG